MTSATLTITSNVNYWYMYTNAADGTGLSYKNDPGYQDVGYYLSTSDDVANGKFTSIPTAAIQISLPTYLTIQVVQVLQPTCQVSNAVI